MLLGPKQNDFELLQHYAEQMLIPFDVRIIANLSPPDWWTIGLTGAATILGAFIGAYVSLLVARQTAKESRTAADAVRREAEEAATLRIEVQLMQLVNATAGYHLAAERRIKAAKEKLGKGDVDTWLVMVSFAGKPTEININADDLVAFTRAREFGYVTRLLYAFSVYNAMIYGAEAHGHRRDELMQKITPETMQGLIGTIALNSDELRELAPHIATVKDLAEQIREGMKEAHQLASSVLDEFGPIVRKYFKDPSFPIPARAQKEAEKPQRVE